MAGDVGWADATHEDARARHRAEPAGADADRSQTTNQANQPDVTPTSAAGLKLGPTALLRLQRKAGNRAVQRLVRTGSRHPDRERPPDAAGGNGPGHEDGAGPKQAPTEEQGPGQVVGEHLAPGGGAPSGRPDDAAGLVAPPTGRDGLAPGEPGAPAGDGPTDLAPDLLAAAEARGASPSTGGTAPALNPPTSGVEGSGAPDGGAPAPAGAGAALVPGGPSAPGVGDAVSTGKPAAAPRPSARPPVVTAKAKPETAVAPAPVPAPAGPEAASSAAPALEGAVPAAAAGAAGPTPGGPPPALDAGGGDGAEGGAAAEPAPGTSDNELGDLESSIASPSQEESGEADAGQPGAEAGGAETAAGAEAGGAPEGGEAAAAGPAPDEEAIAGEAAAPGAGTETGTPDAAAASGGPAAETDAGAGGGEAGGGDAAAGGGIVAEGDQEPVPDVAAGAGEAQSEAVAETEAEAEVERREEEAAPEPEPGPAGAADGAAGGEGSAGAPAGGEQASPEAVPEASVEAGAQAEGSDASEADVQSAANAEVDAASSEGGDDDAGVPSGGGGGGSPVEDKPPPPAPDVAAVPPEQGLSQAGSLPPAQLLSTLGGVQAAAQREAGEARAELAASPPQRPRSPGSPTTVPSPASGRVTGPAGGGPTSPATVPEGADRPVPRRPDPAVPTTPPPAPPTPRIPEAPGGAGMGEGGAQAMRQAIDRLPGSDPALHVPATPAPRVQLAGNADPAAVDAQAVETAADVNAAASQGAADAAHPMGEDELYPAVPDETLRAEVPAGGGEGGDGGGAAGAGAGGPATAAGGESTEDEAASIVAHQEHGGEVQAAVQQGTGQMAAARSERAQGEQQERQRGEQEMARLEQESAAEQAAEREQARGEVSQRRAAWRAEQAQVVGTARSEATQARTQARQDITQEQARGDQEAAEHHQQGQQEAAEARRRGEEEAAREREKGKQEGGGGGFFGWLASKAKSFFDGIKKGIQAAFAAARAAVQAAIQKATQLAHAVIEKARQAAVALVKVAGTVLAGIASVALAAFPRLRDAAVGFIQSRVRAAEAAINNLANKLKEGVSAALNLLGKALNGILNLAEKAYLAAVNFVASAVQGIINKVKAAIELLGAFAGLVKDIAAGPAQWIRNLGAALMDGVRNHLWGAFKTSVKQWFNDKVEQVVGVGKVVWNLLTKGGISLAKIGSMVWEGIKAAIPPALIALLIEKLISLLVPAAAAVMLIIQGLQAAWGAVSRILQAINRFLAFLKAVKTGNAGPQFAQAVAAAAVVVLDFLSNFLLARLAKGASKVGQKLRSIAQRIGQRLKGVMQKVGRKLKGVGRRIRDRARNLRDRLRRRRGKKDPAKKRQRDQENKQKRLDTAVAAIKPAVQRLLSKGVSKFRLKAQLLYYKVRYRLSSLTMGEGNRAQITATVNPKADVAHAVKIVGGELHRILNEVGEQLMQDAAVRGEIERINAARGGNVGRVDPATGQPMHGPRVAQSPAGESAAIHGAHGGEQRPRGIREDIEMAPGVTVRERQTYSSAPGHIETQGIGGHGRYKSDVQHALRDAQREGGLSDAELRDAVFSIMGGRTPDHPAFQGPGGADRLARVGAVTRLISVVEPGRHPGAHATSYMGMTLLGEGDTNAARAVTELNPMSAGGATGEATRSRIPEGTRTPAQQRDAHRHLRREVKTTIAYIKMLMRTEQVVFSHTDQCVTWIREKLKDHLLQRLRSVMWPNG